MRPRGRVAETWFQTPALLLLCILAASMRFCVRYASTLLPVHLLLVLRQSVPSLNAETILPVGNLIRLVCIYACVLAVVSLLRGINTAHFASPGRSHRLAC